MLDLSVLLCVCVCGGGGGGGGGCLAGSDDCNGWSGFLSV